MLIPSSNPAKRNASMATLTWLGHASFRLDTDGGKRIYVDPWLSGPTCPDSERDPERADVIAVTHGHGDHAGDVVALQQKLGCKVTGMVELMGWFSANGVADDAVVPFNKGGTVELDGIRFTLTNAFHSSSAPDGTYTGEPAGFVIGAESTSIYFAGDTCVFGDMQLIERLYRPQVAVLPIGDHYTMGPEEAALALELLGNPRCVPCHWGTFPLLTGTPDELAKLTRSQVDRIDPGDTVEL
jgi:L-ascorbate metabolism protein UlaG (beta-lactamase superfamily)